MMGLSVEAHRIPLPHAVATRRDGSGRDDVHLRPACPGKAGAVFGYLLVVDLGDARADHAEFHPLAQGVEIIGVQLKFDEVRRQQPPAGRDHEHVGQVAHGHPQHILPVAPRPRGQAP